MRSLDCNVPPPSLGDTRLVAEGSAHAQSTVKDGNNNVEDDVDWEDAL